MSHGIGAGKERAGLAVLALTVAEEERVRCTVSVSEDARLSDEALGQGHSVLNRGSALDYEIVGDDVHSYVHRGFGAGNDGAVAQSGGAFYFGVVPYLHVHDVHCVHNLDVAADYSETGSDRFDIAFDQFADGRDELGVVPVQGGDVCLVRGEIVVDGYLSPTGLVQDADAGAVAEGGLAIGDEIGDILDV